MFIIKKHYQKNGFALPSVLISSIIMLTVLLAAVVSTAAIRVSLVSQYYNQLATNAGDAGITYAKACLSASGGVPQWSNAAPLGPNTDCTGTQLAGFTCPSNDARCSVMVNGDTITTFTIGLPQLSSNGKARNVTSVGSTKLLRSSDGSTWRIYAQNSKLVISDTSPIAPSSATVQYLVVGGGGGGSGGTAGGGGAGGMSTGAISVAYDTYAITVGNGGSGGGLQSYGGNGTDSSALGITAIGGGRGAFTAGSNAASNGGSGGGGANYTGTVASAGSGTSGQGNDGATAPTDGGGGGGGAGAAGSGRNGGAGLVSSISGISEYYAGGGGGSGGAAGGDGGIGGGGAGATSTATAGTANTGGGGGGGWLYASGYGGAGGSGIVIISYPTGSMTATGGTITTSGGNTIHTFTSGGTFTITVITPTVTVQALVVAGGGGGGTNMGGGGGGGGVIYNSSYDVAPQAYNVTVGAGGNGAPAGTTGGHPTVTGTNGGNSVFGNLIAIGGGWGGVSFNDMGLGINFGNSGGSGGGSSGYNNNSVAPGYYGSGAGTSGQGYRGGYQGNAYYSGGGGGAGGAGADGNAQANGGPGVANSILGTSYYWGGGGGGAGYSICGGNGGNGGGGGGAVCATTGGSGLNNGSAGGGGSVNSQTNTPGGNAGANTGGGGGAGSHYNATNKGGDGGSGIVIISYPTGSITAVGGIMTTSGGDTIHTFKMSGNFTVGASQRASCSAILSAGESIGDGLYWIYPAGSTGIQVYCDMTNDGGGWTKIYEGLATSSTSTTRTLGKIVEISDNITFNNMKIQAKNWNYSIIGTTTGTAMLVNTFSWYYAWLYSQPDASSPNVMFHDINSNQTIQFTVLGQILSGYGNSWRNLVSGQYNLQNADSFMYLGGVTASIHKADWGYGDYNQHMNDTSPNESGLGLTPYKFQEIYVWVK